MNVAYVMLWVHPRHDCPVHKIPPRSPAYYFATTLKRLARRDVAKTHRTLSMHLNTSCTVRGRLQTVPSPVGLLIVVVNSYDYPRVLLLCFWGTFYLYELQWVPNIIHAVCWCSDEFYTSIEKYPILGKCILS